MKKKDFIKIVQEEIQNVLSEEMTEPPDYISKKFPEVVEYDRFKKFTSLNWVVITLKKWDRNKALDFQEAMGYAYAGYGGPYEFEEQELPDNKFKYTWWCAGAS